MARVRNAPHRRHLRMKILIAHNYYASTAPSGEDVVFRDELALLSAGGIEPVCYEKHSDIRGMTDKIRAGIAINGSRRTYRDLRALLTAEQVDVAHFHNIYPFISPSAYRACRDEGVAVVQTLHNFRMFCANGMLLDKHGVCESCLHDKQFARAVLKGCYRNSRVASLPVAVMQYRQQRRWAENIDLFIALTEFARDKYIEAGLPAAQIVVKPNFVFQQTTPARATQNGAIFIGRLKYEKGVDILLDAWRQLPDVPLHIYGDGPEAAKIVAAQQIGDHLPSVRLHGHKSQIECQQALAQLEFLVMTSRWYEGFPRVIVEAYACGRPVVVPRLGGMAAVVEEGVTGLLYRPGDANDLVEKVHWLKAHPHELTRMGENALRIYHARYSPEVNRERLLEIYAQAVELLKFRSTSLRRWRSISQCDRTLL